MFKISEFDVVASFVGPCRGHAWLPLAAQHLTRLSRALGVLGRFLCDNFELAAPRTELEMELASGARLAFLFFAGAFFHSGFWPSWFRISRFAKPGRCTLARPVAGTSKVRDPCVDISHHFELPTTFFEFSRRSWAQRNLHVNSANCTIREWKS